MVDNANNRMLKFTVARAHEGTIRPCFCKLQRTRLSNLTYDGQLVQAAKPVYRFNKIPDSHSPYNQMNFIHQPKNIHEFC